MIVFKLVGWNGTLPEGAALIYFSIFLGLSAGVFEETTRYLAYRYRLTSPASRTFQSALMFGAGHGGIESILLVGLGGIGQLIAMTVLRKKDLDTMDIPAEQIELLRKQIHDYWSFPWYGVLLADIERIFTMIVHVAMTVMVLQCFRNSQSTSRLSMLFLAILWHAGLDALAVMFVTMYSVYMTELLVAIWALASLGILRYFYDMDRRNEQYAEIDTPVHDASGVESEPLTQKTTQDVK